MQLYRTHLKNAPKMAKFDWQIIASVALWFGITFIGCYNSHNTSRSSVQTEQEQDFETNADSKEPAVSNQGISGKWASLQIEMQPDSAVLCPGECIDIAVRVFGGSPPYHVSWDHELFWVTTLGPHEVCPDSNTTYTVSVRDTGLDSQEFVIPPEQLQGRTTITVVDDCGPTILLDAGDDANVKDASEHSYADASDVADASDNTLYDASESMSDALCAPNCPDLEWVTIPGGVFMMGSAEGVGSANEHPQHEVTVQTFRMSKTEITVMQYGMCLAADVCSEPYTDPLIDGINWGKSGRENHPVEVDWPQAIEFAEWLGGRLPSEAEWEYAARGGGRDILYPWGDEAPRCEYAVIYEDASGNSCGNERSMEVCSKPLGNTAQGLCDMSGNAQEWVEDYTHLDYSGAPIDGQVWIDNAYSSHPVIRGCSIGSDPDDCRVAARNLHILDGRVIGSGFRVVLDL